jgi:flagellar assembly factor FliW
MGVDLKGKPWKNGKKCILKGWHGRCFTPCQMNTAELETDTQVSFQNETVIHLPSGLLGFEQVKRYTLSSVPGEEPFQWFRNQQDPALAFVVVSPFEVFPAYAPDLPSEDVRFLGLESPEDALLLNIVTLRKGGRATVNLKGPIVINRFSLLGKQVVIANAAEYSVQHPLPTEQPETE